MQSCGQCLVQYAAPFTVCSTLWNVQCAICNVHFAVYNVQCTVCSAQVAECNVPCAVQEALLQRSRVN